MKSRTSRMDLEELKIGGLSDDQVADQFENEMDEELDDDQDDISDAGVFNALAMRYEIYREELSQAESENGDIQDLSGFNTFMLGDNRDGICGNEVLDVFAKGLSLIYKRFSKIACGYHHNAAIDENGRVYTWGRGTFGQLGQTEITNQALPTRIALPLMNIPVVEISCGWQHTLAVTSNGFLYSWGLNINGQLGLGDYTDRDTPTFVESMIGQNIVKVAAGHSHSAMITDSNKLYTWGANPDSRLCRKTTYYKLSQRPKNINKPML